jgi:hypothetical protein
MIKKICGFLLLSISIGIHAHKNCARHFKHDKLGQTAWERIDNCSCNCSHYRSQISKLKYTDRCPGCNHIFLLSEEK